MYQIARRLGLILGGCLSLLLLHSITAPIGLTHWADLAVAEVTLDRTRTEILLTVPTGLLGNTDDDRDGRLSSAEINRHQAELQTQLSNAIVLQDGNHRPQTVNITALDPGTANLPSSSSRHSNLRLLYTWSRPIARLKMDYRLFAPDVPSARCFVTIRSQAHPDRTQTTAQTTAQPTTKTVIFSPDNQTAVLFNNAAFNNGAIDWSKGMWATILGAFLWGAAHATSPGHGKTLVGTYLIGERATANHAIFLGLTTTITHTLGVFTLGGITLLAAQTFLPEQLLPWLSLASGLMVVGIGVNLLRDRLRPILKQSEANHEHHHALAHAHDHHHHEHHHHEHDHAHHHHEHDHSHLPPEGAVSWRSLLALGVSGGLIPCPSALVLLLSAIAIGQVAYGLLLVLSFSLGLAVILTGLGLLLIYAKQLFVKLPLQKLQKMKWLTRLIPACTAMIITLIGVGISLQALISVPAIGQMKGLPL